METDEGKALRCIRVKSRAPLDLLEGLATTRSIRRYTDDPVDLEDLRSILWHAGRAPSGSNRQPFRFLVLRDGTGFAHSPGIEVRLTRWFSLRSDLEFRQGGRMHRIRFEAAPRLADGGDMIDIHTEQDHVRHGQAPGRADKPAH